MTRMLVKMSPDLDRLSSHGATGVRPQRSTSKNGPLSLLMQRTRFPGPASATDHWRVIWIVGVVYPPSVGSTITEEPMLSYVEPSHVNEFPGPLRLSTVVPLGGTGALTVVPSSWLAEQDDSDGE